MKIPFWKMHGAGNDFILADDRAGTFPAADGAWIAAAAARRTGVGSEGVILIQPSDRADFRMRFFNPDGGEAEMCGNGARCAARLAHEIGAAPANMAIETAAGILSAEIRPDGVRLRMTPPTDWRLNRTLELGGESVSYHFVNSGVPHAVVEVDDLEETEVDRLGRAIRGHRDFAPAGANANFVQVEGPNALRIRTYERGVEAETLACGTGVVASALIAGKLGWSQPPVRVAVAGGDVLRVDYRLTPESAEDVTLLGPTAHVFEGVLTYPG